MKDISTTYYTSNDQNCSALNGREIDQSELEDNAIAHSYMDAIYLYGHMLHETGYEQKNASLFLNQFRNKTVKFEAENKEIIMDINGDQATQFALYCANKKGFWSICLVGFSCITQLITIKTTVMMFVTCVLLPKRMFVYQQTGFAMNIIQLDCFTHMKPHFRAKTYNQSSWSDCNHSKR